MPKVPVCNCPPEQSEGQTPLLGNQPCPRCQGRRPSAELLPVPAKRSKVAAASTDFPKLKMDQVREQASGSSLPESTSSSVLQQSSHRSEQRKICRLLGVAVLIWALFSLLPGGVAWRSWVADWSADSFPFWIAIFCAFGSTPLCLGVLLLQLPDWGTLKSAAGGLLVIACGYAFAATLFGLSGPNSGWLAWLDFPHSNKAAATLWCTCMLVLAATLSLICFLESQRWRRVEQLFAELHKSSEPRLPVFGSSLESGE